MRAHHQVRVPVATRLGAVRADAADLGGEVEDELGLRVGEQTLGVGPVRQVVLGLAGRRHLMPLRLEPLDEVGAEEARPAGDEDAAHRAGARSRVCQSTRPIQRWRCSEYQRIVRRTPSSHVIFGSQPVSRFSFS